MKTMLLAPRHVAGIASLLGAACVAFACPAQSQDGKSHEILYRCDDLASKSIYSTFSVKMYQGYDGWFFREGDLQSLFDLPDETISFLQNVNDALKYRGVHLIVVPMVPRGIVGGDQLPNSGILPDMLYDRTFAEEQFSAFISNLQSHGLDVVDVAKTLNDSPDFNRDAYYFKRDIHWTPEGAQIVAGATGDHILKLDGDDKSAIDFETTVEAQPRAHKANFNTILNELCQSKIAPEVVNVYETKQNLGSLDDLLGEEGADGSPVAVHVVGSSYTDDANVYNFTGFLRQKIKQDVGGFSVSGGGVDQSLYGWAQNPNGLDKRPKFLVWEFADFVDLRKLTPVMNSTIVPSIIGDCSGELALSESKFEETNQVSTELPSLSGDSSQYYLQYSLSNKALAGFSIAYNYKDGSTKNVTFSNPTRIGGLGKLYQTLPEGGEIPITNVRVTFDKGAISAGSVKLCRYPTGVFRGETTSN